jgi:glutamate N-acetyltransferase/amino-acid N-acetyltransferase
MKIEEVSGGICAVKGVRAYGIKEGSKGLALIEGGGKATGVFTLNKLKAAPLLFTKRQLENGRISAVIANSGCANSFTGEQGMKNAEKMAELVASALGVIKEEVAVLSTGPIGAQLNMALIEQQLGEVAEGLTSDDTGSTEAAKAIMTTDTFHKEHAVSIDAGNAERVVIGGIAKGSGMIFPDMATMLSFIYTDAALSEEALRKCLKDAVDNSFNMIVVDGDMSTNDMVLLVATGRSVRVEV